MILRSENRRSKSDSGFTLIEMFLVLGISAVIFSLAAGALIRPQTQSSLDGEILKIVADIKNQQMKSMIGDTEGGGVPQPYGINIQPNQYVLFRGSVYNPADTDNFTVLFPDNVQISADTLPAGTLVFNRRSGEVSSFISPVSFSLQDMINLSVKTVTVRNILGSLAITP